MASRLDGLIRATPHQLRSRALVKTLLYRVVMVAITVAVALFFTGNVGEALNIGIAANVVKTGTYYVYERLWDRIAWVSRSLSRGAALAGGTRRRDPRG